MLMCLPEYALVNETSAVHDEREYNDGICPGRRIAVRLPTVLVSLCGLREEVGIAYHLQEKRIGEKGEGSGWVRDGLGWVGRGRR